MPYAIGSTKQCSSCRDVFDLSCFGKNKRQPDGFQNVCNGCKRAYWNRWHQENYTNVEYRTRLNATQIRVMLNKNLKKYGISREQYEKLAANGCAICEGPPTGRGRFHFAENQVTGKFGALLCSHCNTALGLLKYDTERLSKMIDYLNKNSQSE